MHESKPRLGERRRGTLLLLTLVALVVVLAAVWSLLPLEHTTIAVDGESISLSAISGWHAALAIAAAVAAVLLALVIAVLAVVLALGLAVFGIVVAMALSVAGRRCALVFSPLLLLKLACSSACAAHAVARGARAEPRSIWPP